MLRKNLLLAGHDRSDGGLITTVFEMALLTPYRLILN